MQDFGWIEVLALLFAVHVRECFAALGMPFSVEAQCARMYSNSRMPHLYVQRLNAPHIAHGAL